MEKLKIKFGLIGSENLNKHRYVRFEVLSHKYSKNIFVDLNVFKNIDYEIKYWENNNIFFTNIDDIKFRCADHLHFYNIISLDEYNNLIKNNPSKLINWYYVDKHNLSQENYLATLPKNKKELHSELPETFTTGQAILIGEKHCVKTRALKRFLKDSFLFINTKHGEYKKTIKENLITNDNNKVLNEDSIIKTYIMKDDNTGFYKIGKSINPKFREQTLQSKKPTIKIIKIWEKNIEKELHNLYTEFRIRGEWFNLSNIQLKYICTNF